MSEKITRRTMVTALAAATTACLCGCATKPPALIGEGSCPDYNGPDEVPHIPLPPVIKPEKVL